MPKRQARKNLPPRRCFTKFSPLKQCDVLPAGTDRRASGRAGSPALAKVHRVKHQAAWNRSTRCAGLRCGARAGRLRCVRMLTMTAQSSIAAMIFRRPPQCGQCSTSISKKRLSRYAQLMRAREPCACSAGCSVACCAGLGTIAARNVAWGRHASYPHQISAATWRRTSLPLCRSCGALNGCFGHTAEVRGPHSLAAAFEDGAERRTLSSISG